MLENFWHRRFEIAFCYDDFRLSISINLTISWQLWWEFDVYSSITWWFFKQRSSLEYIQSRYKRCCKNRIKFRQCNHRSHVPWINWYIQTSMTVQTAIFLFKIVFHDIDLWNVDEWNRTELRFCLSYFVSKSWMKSRMNWFVNRISARRLTFDRRCLCFWYDSFRHCCWWLLTNCVLKLINCWFFMICFVRSRSNFFRRCTRARKFVRFIAMSNWDLSDVEIKSSEALLKIALTKKMKSVFWTCRLKNTENKWIAWFELRIFKNKNEMKKCLSNVSMMMIIAESQIK